MSEARVTLLSDATNNAVVHLDSRRYPGVVFQGDSLNEMIKSLRRVQKLYDVGEEEEAASELMSICEGLENIRSHYERICLGQKISLPY